MNCSSQELEPTIMEALAFCIILSTEFYKTVEYYIDMVSHIVCSIFSNTQYFVNISNFKPSDENIIKIFFNPQKNAILRQFTPILMNFYLFSLSPLFSPRTFILSFFPRAAPPPHTSTIVFLMPYIPLYLFKRRL